MGPQQKATLWADIAENAFLSNLWPLLVMGLTLAGQREMVMSDADACVGSLGALYRSCRSPTESESEEHLDDVEKC